MAIPGPEGESNQLKAYIAEQNELHQKAGEKGFPHIWQEAQKTNIPPNTYQLIDQLFNAALPSFTQTGQLPWRQIAESLFRESFAGGNLNNEYIFQYLIYYISAVSFMRKFQEVAGIKSDQTGDNLLESLRKDPAVPKNLLEGAIKRCAFTVRIEDWVESEEASHSGPFGEMGHYNSRLFMLSSVPEIVPASQDLASARAFANQFFTTRGKD